MRTALGLHPQLAHERHGELDLFDQFLAETEYVGEIGLDGHPEFRRHWKQQTQVFEQILSRCSTAGGRIMSVHSRRASSAVLDHLEQFPRAGMPVLHWFSGTADDLNRAVDIGCWFSVGPAMLCSANGRMLASRMPAERVLTESDGPFAQLDGQPVMPWHIARAIDVLADIWSVSSDDATTTVRDNLQRLLAKKTTTQVPSRHP